MKLSDLVANGPLDWDDIAVFPEKDFYDCTPKPLPKLEEAAGAFCRGTLPRRAVIKIFRRTESIDAIRATLFSEFQDVHSPLLAFRLLGSTQTLAPLEPIVEAVIATGFNLRHAFDLLYDAGNSSFEIKRTL